AGAHARALAGQRGGRALGLAPASLRGRPSLRGARAAGCRRAGSVAQAQGHLAAPRQLWSLRDKLITFAHRGRPSPAQPARGRQMAGTGSHFPRSVVDARRRHPETFHPAAGLLRGRSGGRPAPPLREYDVPVWRVNRPTPSWSAASRRVTRVLSTCWFSSISTRSSIW